jgi:hypothetical protein
MIGSPPENFRPACSISQHEKRHGRQTTRAYPITHRRFNHCQNWLIGKRRNDDVCLRTSRHPVSAIDDSRYSRPKDSLIVSFNKTTSELRRNITNHIRDAALYSSHPTEYDKRWILQGRFLVHMSVLFPESSKLTTRSILMATTTLSSMHLYFTRWEIYIAYLRSTRNQNSLAQMVGNYRHHSTTKTVILSPPR